MSDRIFGFEPIIGEKPRILILGSMPSVKSLQMGQYYAHPQNAFWKIQAVLFDEPFTADYEERKNRLMRHGIALWDSCASCVREGSLDSAIMQVLPTDVEGLLKCHPTITNIYCNGGESFRLFRKFHKELNKTYPVTQLVSTSPAAARYTLEEKTENWRQILQNG